MATEPAPLTGGCLCGQIRFACDALPENPHTCSCTMCQRHTGALTVVWVDVPREKLRWTGPGGTPAVWRSSDASSRAFCPTCGTTLGAIDDRPNVGLLTGTFDKPHLKALKPTHHSYRSGRPRWWHPTVDGEPQ